ncbi:MAG: hypothetical protein GY841_14195 [FCB group bacterium]|nr:hypothetical protein [FCB group bacterium]
MSSSHIIHFQKNDLLDTEIKASVNVGMSKANWVSLAIGGFTLSLFTPSPAGISEILKGLHLDDSLIIDYSLEEPIPSSNTIELEVEITSYNADPLQTDSTPLITASGKRVSENYCALSRDIEKEYGLKFGDKIEIEGFGEYEFQDRMNKRIRKGVDIFRWSREEALEIGRSKGVVRITPREQLTKGEIK